MNKPTKLSLTDRAAAWYTAAYRRAEAADTHGETSRLLYARPSFPGQTLYATEEHGGAADRRLCIAARYARLASR